MPRKPRHLSDPSVMLETLKWAHQHALDNSTVHLDGTPLTADTKRLSPKQEKELGRRLGRYWLMEPAVSDTTLQEVVEEVTRAAQAAWESVVKGHKSS